MPRKPDIELESRILNAAYRLWVDQGEHGLTMRSVAKAAGTTTPTLYERFRDKNALMSALRARAQGNLYAAVEPARSLAQVWRLGLEFALAHGHEYELVAKNWAARLSRRDPTPSFDLLKQRLAEELGGTPEEHLRLALALVTLYHGASTLLLAEGLDAKVAATLKQSCLAAVDALVEAARKQRTGPAE